MLSSILFQHVAFITPNNNEKNLILDIGNILNKINESKSINISSNNSTFPFYLILKDPPNTRKHTFIINENDVDYLKYLYHSYNSLTTQFYNAFKKDNNTKLDDLFQRYTYFITEYPQRWPKSIHYYKNVRSIFVHYATDTIPGSWSISPSELEGHTLTHFRENYEIMLGDFNATIRKLNFDFEYLTYVIKKFSNNCLK